MSSSSIYVSVVLIKKVGQCSKQDDVISINRGNEAGKFELRYKEYNQGEPNVFQISDMEEEWVTQYVYILLKNLCLDEEGYELIQLNLPALPTMLVSASKLKDIYYREHFLETIMTSVENIPYCKKVIQPCSHPRHETLLDPQPEPQLFRTPLRTGARHLFFDEE